MAFKIGSTAVKKINCVQSSGTTALKKVYASKDGQLTLVWSAVPDYIYNGGWADSDIISGGSLSTSATAYMVMSPTASNGVTVCEIDVTDLRTISGSFSVSGYQADGGTNGEATAVVKFNGSQIGYQKHTQGNSWEGSGYFSVDVSSMTGWKTLRLEITTTIVQGSTTMNGGSGARYNGSTGISVINCTAL